MAISAEFIRTFEASLDPRLWVKLIREEFDEVQEAFEGDDEVQKLKEIVDLIYVTMGFLNVTNGGHALDDLGRLMAEEEAEAIKRLFLDIGVWADQINAYFDEAVFMEAYDRVHASNMSKLGDDGKPIRRDDGKILKGPNYREPDLTDLV